MFNYLFKRSIPGKDGKRHFRRETSVNREPHFCENWCYRGCWKKQKTTPVKSRENARITHWFGVGHREPFLPIDFLGKIRMNGYIRTILAQKRLVVDLSHIFHGYSIFTYPWRVDFCGMNVGKTTVHHMVWPFDGPRSGSNHHAYRSLDVAVSRELSLIEEEPWLQNRRKTWKLAITHSSKNDGWSKRGFLASLYWTSIWLPRLPRIETIECDRHPNVTIHSYQHQQHLLEIELFAISVQVNVEKFWKSEGTQNSN